MTGTDPDTAGPASSRTGPRLRAVSDLHVSHPANRDVVAGIRPTHPDDWLIVAGDVAENAEDVVDTMELLSRRFARVVWTPGNHELWTLPGRDPARGAIRYEQLVALLRALDVVTPEDPPPLWRGPGGPAYVVPIFTLYDYSWLSPGTSTATESLAAAYAAEIVCTDEFLLHPDPYESRSQWCAARVALTRARLDRLPTTTPWVLVSHWPLRRELTRHMRHQEFVQWCGTELTSDWLRRYPVVEAVYGHLHMPGTTRIDGVPVHEVSIGYPREWRHLGLRTDLARAILTSDPGGHPR